MAHRKYKIEHTCGHKKDRDIVCKSYKEVESYADWLATRPCTDCWKDGKRAARADTIAKRATQIEQQMGVSLPALQGTQPQIDYGAKRRSMLLGDLVFGHVARPVVGGPAAAAKIAPITLAKWWIEAPLAELVVERAAAGDYDAPPAKAVRNRRKARQAATDAGSMHPSAAERHAEQITAVLRPGHDAGREVLERGHQR